MIRSRFIVGRFPERREGLEVVFQWQGPEVIGDGPLEVSLVVPRQGGHPIDLIDAKFAGAGDVAGG
jgi:hypothetical protein